MARAVVSCLVLGILVSGCTRPEELLDLPEGEIESAASQIEWRTRLSIPNPNPSLDDVFGFSTAINDRFVTVGAIQEDEGGISNSGAVYVFDVSDGSLLRRIANPNPTAEALFGYSLTLDGDRLEIAAQYDDVIPGDDAGRAWMFDAPSGTLLYEIGTGNSNLDFYGSSVALAGNRIAVGARNDNPGGINGAGTVSVYDADGAFLYAASSDDAIVGGQFGYSTTISGTRLLVGANTEKSGTENFAGRVHVLHVSDGTHLFDIENPDPLPAGDEFGNSLAADGSIVAIGARYNDQVTNPGSVFVIDLDTLDILFRVDNPLTSLGFGASVAIEGSTLVVGSWAQGAGGSSPWGRVYDFQTGQLLRQINGGAIPFGGIGTHVDIDGDRIVIGTPGATVGAVPRAGTVQVLERNTQPSADSQSLATTEDTPKAIALTGSDSQNDPLTFVVVNPPISGLLSGTPPALTYTPAADFHGTDFFTFKASEQPSGALESGIATIHIEVSAADDLPTASNDSLTTPEDTAAIVTVLSNDGGFGDAPIAVSILSAPANGEAFALAGNAIRYLAFANYAGSDSFTYRISDADGDTASATVSVTVSAVNDAPVATDNAYFTNEDTELVVAAGSGVLANDVDDGPSGSAGIVVPPASGSLGLAANGSFTYTPNANFFGIDVFTYTMSDGTLTSSPATVVVHVGSVDDLPSAQNDAATANEDGSVNVAVLANDTNLGDGSIVVGIATAPGNGSAIPLSGGLVRYEPHADFEGPDSFSYSLSDADGDISTATVSVMVNALDDAPVAANDAYSIDEDGALTVVATAGVLANDTDGDGTTPTATIVLAPANGALSLAADGSFAYTPDSNFAGADFFVYQATDGNAGSIATVILSVSSVQDAPTAPVLLEPAAEDDVQKDFSFSWAPATDPDGDPITYTVEVLEDGAPVAEADSLVTVLTLEEPLGKGDYTWTVEARDSFGNSTTSAPSPFHVKGSGGGGGGCSITSVSSSRFSAWLLLLGAFALGRRRRAC